MSQPSSLTSRAWIIIPLCAAGFLIWTNHLRLQRVEFVSGVARGDAAITRASPTGYEGGTRELIVPEHIGDSYEWIAQTQQMLGQGEWRVRHIDYENAPFGRAVHAASPYRWWLGLVAWFDHLASGRPLGLAVERAAHFADPLLHLLLVVVGVFFVARQFGAFPAALFSLGLATLFPFAAGFLPGVPDDYGLKLVVAVSGLLLLLAGMEIAPALAAPARGKGVVSDPAAAGRRARRWFFAAGMAGGIGIWIGVASQVPILAGIALGAVLAAWVARRAAPENPVLALGPGPWRAWALGGASTVFATYLIEYFPAHLGSWELRVIHPLYGLAWLGGGELLARTVAWLQREKASWRARDFAALVLAAAGVAALPFAMWRADNQGIMAVDLLSFRLTNQPDGIMAPNIASWLSRDGFSAIAWATFLPALLLGASTWMIFRRRTGTAHRMALAVALGPVLVVLGLAYLQLRSLQLVDGVLLALLVVATAAAGGGNASVLRRWVWAGAVALVLAPGAIQLLPQKEMAGKNVLTVPEVEGLVERDLAHWLARHAGADSGAVVLAPPSLTNTLYYYGGLRGLGTFSWENKDGLSVALRMMISTSPEEAHALVRRRGVTHIVVPSWDPFFEDYTRSASIQSGELFLTGLHRWAQPSWLRPIPYQLPTIAGFEEQSVLIFEVVDDQDDAMALSRMTEYFIEMGQLENAKAAGQALRRFPSDFGALVARAQEEAAVGDAASFGTTFDTLLKRLASGADRVLPWDRRASLAVVLARGKRMDLARGQVQHCLAEVDETRLRSLTTYSLFHLLGLGKAFGLGIADQRLHALALELLPADLTSRL